MKIKNYVKPASLEEAYELNKKKSSRLAGGMMWMRLGKGTVQTLVDLSGLGLDTVEETEEEFQIGSMVTLRTLELHQGLNAWTNGCIREAIHPIVGVQFRNLATVGGSIWGRFGFSDVLTVFLALDAWVELYKGGRMPLRTFAEQKKDNDILMRIIVKKTPRNMAYQSFRNTKTDFPVLTCCVSLGEEEGVAVIGARPGRAKVYSLAQEVFQTLLRSVTGEGCASSMQVYETAAKELAAQVPMGSNLRAGKEYRTHLAEVLLKRAFCQMEENGKAATDKTEKTEENRGGDGA